MPGVWLGIVLGLLDVFVIATGMADVYDEAAVAAVVVMLGLVPGVGLGALLGWLAEVIGPLPVPLRRFVLIVPALLLVILLGGELSLQRFVMLASIPTVVAALVLERATRFVAAPVLPVARAVARAR